VVTIKLADKWIWDSWYVRDGNTWHAYFLQADRALGNPDLRHFNVSQGHATSLDLVTWAHLGTCFAPAPKPAWDDTTTWTGSVVQDDAGLWHLFYTGGSSAEAALYQRIGHATSHDLHSWERVGSGLALDFAPDHAGWYEIDHDPSKWTDRCMRDPWVMRDPDGSGWLMYFTARAAGIAEPNAGGAIGVARSPDLLHWTIEAPMFVGGFGQIEVPQVVRIGAHWYCLFCSRAQDWSVDYQAASGERPVTGTHYLIADHLTGPWRIAPGPFLDGTEPCTRYAARLVDGPDGLVLLGFADGGRDHFGGFIMDPAPIVVGTDGFLKRA